MGFDERKEFATGHKKQIIGIEGGKIFGIEKSSVMADRDRDIGPIFRPDLLGQIGNHTHGLMLMIAMRPATAKPSIDGEALPVDLQRLKTLFPLISRADAMPFNSLIVVHHHGVHHQDDDPRLLDFQTPDEKAAQNSAEQWPAADGKQFEEAFDLMRGGQTIRTGFNTGGVAGVLAEFIEPRHGLSGAIHEKANDLMEKFQDRQPFEVFAQMAEGFDPNAEQADLKQIAVKEDQTATIRKVIGGNFNTLDRASWFRG